MSRWTGDIYITDESGAEIPGSRRHVSRTVTFEEISAALARAGAADGRRLHGSAQRGRRTSFEGRVDPASDHPVMINSRAVWPLLLDRL